MIILAVSDHVDPLVYSHNIKERFSNVDCIIGAGDLDISYYEYIVSCLNKPLYFVFGNHNLKNLSFFRPDPHAIPELNHEPLSWGFGSVCVDGSIIKDPHTGLIIAGLGGSRKYNNGMHQFTEWQMSLRIIKLIPRMIYYRIQYGRWMDILITHASPANIHDRDDMCHKGFKIFLWLMKRFKPRYLIHGHVHLYDINSLRKTQWGETTVINSYNHILIDWEDGMIDNTSSQAELDFTKAKQRAWIESLKNIVNPQAGKLLSFHDIKKLLKPGREKYLGMQTIPIKSIVGSEDRYQDFSRHFFPKKEHLRHRWMSIDKAHLTYVNLPPIKLLKIGGLYFVRDGNHRVSVALSQGIMDIDAEVIELTAEVHIEQDATRDEILRAVLSWERRRVLDNTQLDKIIPVEMIEFTAPGRWHEVLNHIEGHKYFMGIKENNEVSFEDAARSWYNELYLPIVKLIRNEKLLPRFPNRTEADLYIWIIKHWHCLKEKYGEEYPLDKAASEYSAAHGRGFLTRWLPYIKRLFRWRS